MGATGVEHVEKTRIVYIDPAAQKAAGQEFVSNRVVTSKYNVITFLPIFLFEMFSRVAYLYFLLQVCYPDIEAGGQCKEAEQEQQNRVARPALLPGVAAETGMPPWPYPTLLFPVTGGPVVVERHLAF